MKKYLIAGLIFMAPALSHADIFSRTRAIIGPTVSVSSVTISSTPYRTCITSIDISQQSPMNTGFVFRMLDGGTTIYTMQLSTGVALSRDWELNSAPCGTPATQFFMTISSAASYNINYRGIVQ